MLEVFAAVAAIFSAIAAAGAWRVAAATHQADQSPMLDINVLEVSRGWPGKAAVEYQVLNQGPGIAQDVFTGASIEGGEFPRFGFGKGALLFAGQSAAPSVSIVPIDDESDSALMTIRAACHDSLGRLHRFDYCLGIQLRMDGAGTETFLTVEHTVVPRWRLRLKRIARGAGRVVLERLRFGTNRSHSEYE